MYATFKRWQYSSSDSVHGADSQVILVTTSMTLLKEVEKEIEVQLSTLSRKRIAEKSIAVGTPAENKQLITALKSIQNG